MREEHIVEYMTRIQTVYATGVTTEHSFRPPQVKKAIKISLPLKKNRVRKII